MKKAAILAVLFAANASAAPYWLKAYPNASEAKKSECVKVADAVYAKEQNSGTDNLQGFARLQMGKAYESCMESK